MFIEVYRINPRLSVSDSQRQNNVVSAPLDNERGFKFRASFYVFIICRNFRLWDKIKVTLDNRVFHVI